MTYRCSCELSKGNMIVGQLSINDVLFLGQLLGALPVYLLANDVHCFTTWRKMKKVEMTKWNETRINFVAVFCFTNSETNIVRHSLSKVADTKVHGKVNLLEKEYCLV